MTNWVFRPWRQAFDFRGRATRREYWLFLVQLYGLGFAMMFVFGVALGATASPEAGQLQAEALLGAATWILILLGFVPYLSASVRRLHDHDKSGWLFLLAFIPLVGWLFFLFMMLTPGSEGENGYGHDPREGDRPATEEMVGVFS